MGAFLYGVSLQWKLDIRSKTLRITCYIVPLLFFAIMGGIFTSVMPEVRYTLIQSMTVFGVTMGALINSKSSRASQRQVRNLKMGKIRKCGYTCCACYRIFSLLIKRYGHRKIPAKEQKTTQKIEATLHLL